MSLNLNSRRLKARVKVDRFAPCNNGACAHYVMVSGIQWKSFWLATQLYPPNDRTGWQKLISVNYDVPVFARPHYVWPQTCCVMGWEGGGGGRRRRGFTHFCHVVCRTKNVQRLSSSSSSKSSFRSIATPTHSNVHA